MTGRPEWLPGLLLFANHGASWSKYINAVYALFYRDFIESHPIFQGRPVFIKRYPVEQGKERGFWHATSEGTDEATRRPANRALVRGC